MEKKKQKACFSDVARWWRALGVEEVLKSKLMGTFETCRKEKDQQRERKGEERRAAALLTARRKSKVVDRSKP